MRDVLAVQGVRGAAVSFVAVLYSAPAQTPDPSAGRGVSSLEQLMGAEVRSVLGGRDAPNAPRHLILGRVTSPVAGGAALAHGLRFRVTLDNLFDAAHADPGNEEPPVPIIPQDGRTARLRVPWAF